MLVLPVFTQGHKNVSEHDTRGKLQGSKAKLTYHVTCNQTIDANPHLLVSSSVTVSTHLKK